MENKGFIKLYRQMLGWGWYTDTATKCVFLHLLLLAAWEEGSYREVRLAPGQAVISIRELAAQTGVSVQSVRTALRHLKATGEITQEPRGKYSVFTIQNYALYQGGGAAASRTAAQRKHTPGTGPIVKNPRNKDTLLGEGGDGGERAGGLGEDAGALGQGETAGGVGDAGALGGDAGDAGAGAGDAGRDAGCFEAGGPSGTGQIAQGRGADAQAGQDASGRGAAEAAWDAAGAGRGDEPRGFSAFWAAYPRKRARADALRAWKALSPSKALQGRMLSALEGQKAGADWQREGGRFVPYPGAWLRGRRWEDEPEAAATAPSAAPVELIARGEWDPEKALDGEILEAREEGDR